MNISSLHPAIKAADQSLETLARNKNIPESEKVAEVSRQFEALLLRQILSQARKSVVHSKFDTNSTTSSVYEDMVTTQLADKISQSGGFGLARSLQTQLARQVLTPSDAATKTTPAPLPSSERPTQ